MSAPAHVAYLSTRSSGRGVIGEQSLQPLPMCGCVTEVTTQWYFARVSVRSEFRNPSAQVIKTFGCFDLPERVGGHLASLRAEVGKHFLQARVAETVSGPKTTAQQAPSPAFTFDVPWLVHGGASVVVTAVFMIPLRVVGTNQVAFTIPRELVPKAPAAKAEDADDDTPVGEAWGSMFAIKSEPRLPPTVLIHGRGNFFAAVDGNAKASLPGAAVTRLGDPRRFEIRYENRDVVDQPAKDFEVVASLIPDEDPIVIQAVKEDAPFVDEKHRYAIAIAAAPKFAADAADPNIEVSVLCDCSGSMAPYAGPVKRAVRGLLASLPDSVFANLMRFGDKQEWALHESVQLHDQADADALATFPLAADLGKTKLYQAVGDAYVKPVVQGHARVMVIVSDGAEEKHTQRLIELAAANAHTTRVVAVTLGEHVDQALFAMLAQVTNGAHVHCSDPEQLPEALANAVDPMLVPHLTGTQVTFAYDGSEEQPPVVLANEHPPMIASGTKALVYAFGSGDLRGCTVNVSGLVGSEYREMKAYTGAPDQFEVNSSTENDIATISLVHAAAAASRVDALVNMNAKSALSDDERHEVLALSLAFAVPSPFTKMQCRTGEQDAASFDPKARVVNAPFVERRARYLLPAVSKPRGPNGAAMDADEAGLAAVASLPTETRCPAGATAAQYLRSVVDACVADVVASASIDDAIQRQQRGGFWVAHRAFPVFDLCGLTHASVVSSMPESIVPVKKTPTPQPASKPASKPPTPAAADAIPTAPSTDAAASASATAPASPAAAVAATDATAAASTEAGADLPEATPAEELPAAPVEAPPAAPTPAPYNGAQPEDLWATALIATMLKASPTHGSSIRTKWTLRRANQFIDDVGAAGTRARTAAEAFVASLPK